MENNDFQIKSDADLIKPDSKIVFWTFCISIISAFIIIILHNIKIDAYLKYIIVPFSILLINYGIIIKLAKYQINRQAYLWLIPIIAILISDIILPIDISNLVLNVMILPVLISCFFFSMINENYAISRSFGKWMFKLLPVFRAGLLSNLGSLANLYADNVKTKNKKILNILFGVCIGIPIAMIILSLLISADKYFSVFMSQVTKIFENLVRVDFLFQNIFILIISFLVFYNIILNIIKHKNTKEKALAYYNINYDISKTVLVIVNLVFVLFLVSEISKITINFLALPIEYTYAEYAREGFFQLLFVTAINFSIILFYLYYVNKGLENKTVKKMLLTLIMFSILLIFNSYYRMFLYIGAYGFTILRLQVILFLLMELIMLIIMIKKLIYKLKHEDAKLFAIVIIGTYIINLYYCIEPFVDFLNRLL